MKAVIYQFAISIFSFLPNVTGNPDMLLKLFSGIAFVIMFASCANSTTSGPTYFERYSQQQPQEQLHTVQQANVAAVAEPLY